ncbi:hypothetical protein CCH79_00016929, partial [Gambusia affinis]
MHLPFNDRYDTLKQQLWKVFLLSEEQMDYQTLLGLSGNQLYLPVVGKKKLYDRAVKVLQAIATKVNVCLYGDRKDPLCSILRDSLLETLPCIRSLRMTYRSAGSMNWEKCNNTMEQDQKNMFLDLCFTTALHSKQKFHTVMPELVTVCQIKTDLVNTLVDLHQHAISRGLSTDFPTLRPVFQSTPADWLIDLSERKVSTLLEMLKLQSEKKKVELTGCSHDESEMRNLLQCLPYLSKLSFVAGPSESSESIWFLEMLIRAAAEMKEQKGVNMLELLSVCTYKGTPLQWKWCDFLLDLYSSKTETGLTISSFISVLQSADPAIWFVYLSKTKASMLLDVLKLQSGKKQVNLTGCSHEEAEVRSFLQCLPYISQLSDVEMGLPDCGSSLVEICGANQILNPAFLSLGEISGLRFELQRFFGLKRHIRADRLIVFVVFLVIILRLVGDIRAFLSGQTPQQDGDGAEEDQQHHKYHVISRCPAGGAPDPYMKLNALPLSLPVARFLFLYISLPLLFISPSSLFLVLEELVATGGNHGDECHELLEVALRVAVGVQTLHQAVQRGLVFDVLQ